MRRALAILAAVGFVSAAGLLSWRLAPRLLPGLRPPPAVAVRLPSLEGLAAWWNGGPFPDDSLRGAPVVLLLWSDADPRAEAALGAMQAWHAAYAPLGAHVLAVHEPEYAYAADTAVTGRLVRHWRLGLPVGDDPSGRLAARLGGATDGPQLVVADEHGVVVVDTVAALAPGDAALRAWARRARPAEDVPPPLATPELPPVRVVGLGAGEPREGPLAGLAAGHEEVFTAEFRYQQVGRPFVPFPVGGWRVGAEGLEATRGGAANFVAIRYSASRVGVVVSPPPGARARLWVLLDDHWPAADRRGADVSAGTGGAAFVSVSAPGLYWIEQGRGERVLQLSPDQRGLELHALVFENAEE
jgi:hypothetical protein